MAVSRIKFIFICIKGPWRLFLPMQTTICRQTIAWMYMNSPNWTILRKKSLTKRQFPERTISRKDSSSKRQFPEKTNHRIECVSIWHQFTNLATFFFLDPVFTNHHTLPEYLIKNVLESCFFYFYNVWWILTFADLLKTLSIKILSLSQPFDASYSSTSSPQCRLHSTQFLESLINLDFWALKSKSCAICIYQHNNDL